MQDDRLASSPRLLPQYTAVVLMVIVVTLLHYNTAVHIHQAHGIYRRLYYFPIIFAAFLGGWRAGLATALFVCLVYIPHAFGLIGFDPAPTLEKILEMGLYVAVGLVTGVLVSREAATRRSLIRTAAGLHDALREKERVEAELVRAARLATVGRLSAGLAHEIRNPLASIKGAAEVLQDDFPPDHPKGNLLRILSTETARLNDVLTRFLAFARPQSGQRETIDLLAETEQVADLVRQRPDAGTIDIAFSTDPSVRWVVEGDREQIRQLLLNLVLNAVQASGPEGVVHITLAGGSAPGLLTCRVEDNGPGFSPEALEHYGTPFFTTRAGGTGLGLAICHRIMEDLEGTLNAANLPEGGAVVTLTFPVGTGDD